MADRGRPIPIGAAIYASAHKAVQPPDDRTYSAEVTVFQRNLPHHRSARAVFPYTRSYIIPPLLRIVKQNFRKNHKLCFVFSCKLRAAGRPYAIRPIRGFSVQPANQLRLFDHVGISLTKKTCHCEPVRLSGVAIRIPFRTLMTQFPKKENGLPRRFAPRNDT